MCKNIFFTPGPAQIYPGVQNYIQNAFNEDICSISHRSKKFHEVFEEAENNLRALLGLPNSWKVLFTSSATEIWESFLDSCTSENSFHFVNGSFSKRFFEFSKELGRNVQAKEATFGEGFKDSDLNAIPKGLEAYCLTSNETSSGVYTQESFIHKIKELNPNSLVAVDAVSSYPYPKFDYNKIDTAFFSVQKAFGLPAGLGVWLVNEKCIARAEELIAKGAKNKPHNNLLSLVKYASKSETACTPNVLSIYLLAKVTGNMLTIGADVIRKETDIKAAKLYAAIENHPAFEVFVKEKEWQSPTVIVANTKGDSADVINSLKSSGLVLGSGYSSFKNKQVRIANFPAVSEADIDVLIEKIKNL